MSAARNPFYFKVGLFALAVVLSGVAFVGYLLHARGFFENTYRLNLAAPSADGVAPGVPLVFSGMEIGRVASVGLNDEGGIVIRANLLERNARWLRQTSTFTLDKPIVGGARIRVDTPDLSAPPLPDDSTMLLLTSDISREIPGLVERVKGILDNVEHLTRKDGEVLTTLANVQTLTGKMTGEHGVLEGVLGTPEKAQTVTESLAKTRTLITRIDGMMLRMDGRLFAEDGVVTQSQASLVQVRAMLEDVHTSLKRADALMANAVAISGNVKEGTQDLAVLRAEIDDAVRQANSLVNQINRMWPFASQPEVKLP